MTSDRKVIHFDYGEIERKIIGELCSRCGEASIYTGPGGNICKSERCRKWAQELVNKFRERFPSVFSIWRKAPSSGSVTGRFTQRRLPSHYIDRNGKARRFPDD